MARSELGSFSAVALSTGQVLEQGPRCPSPHFTMTMRPGKESSLAPQTDGSYCPAVDGSCIFQDCRSTRVTRGPGRPR